MAIFEIFSKRQRRARGDVPDVYVYDAMPQALRAQIVHIIQDAFGQDFQYGPKHAEQSYQFVYNALCREYGTFELFKNEPRDTKSALLNYLLQERSIDKVLDVVELCFKYMVVHIEPNWQYKQLVTPALEPWDAVEELNARFKEHGVGYQFESGEIIRVDSEFLHTEAIKPALALLRSKGFAGANEEFLAAHEHYRHGRYKESLNDALKAFESTMKAICTLRKWPFKPTDGAKPLIATCFEKGLFPAFLESQVTSVRSVLESGVPTVRNKLGGHGQGAEPVQVPEFFARYALNLTATSILMLVEAHEALK